MLKTLCVFIVKYIWRDPVTGDWIKVYRFIFHVDKNAF